MEGGPTCWHETLFIHHVRERGLFAKPIQQTSFFWAVWLNFFSKEVEAAFII
jgi:hypothetical protein